MVKGLESIYRKGSRRTESGGWYKQPAVGASCPQEYANSNLVESYWDAFGCTGSENSREKQANLKGQDQELVLAQVL